MELVAYGAQDVYLTGNPQITFFKVVYRRHTNFSIEAIEQSASGNAVIGDSENEASFTIARNGDLVHKVYLTTNTQTSHGIEHGSQIIKEVEISIGGQMIDRYTQEWQDIWNELTIPKCKAIGFKAMTGNLGKSNHNNTDDEGVRMVQIPLLFWFCRNPGLALPLIALQYHEVKIDFKFNKNTEILHNEKNPNEIYEEFKVNLYIDYIYLDTDERRRFAQVSHEYLIEQIQYLKTNDSTVMDININHPVKELIWTSGGAHHGSYQNAKLVLNGHDRFEKQPEEYFQLRQPYDYHTTIPRPNLPNSAKHNISSFTKKKIEEFPDNGLEYMTLDGDFINAISQNPSTTDGVNIGDSPSISALNNDFNFNQAIATTDNFKHFYYPTFSLRANHDSHDHIFQEYPDNDTPGAGGGFAKSNTYRFPGFFVNNKLLNDGNHNNMEHIFLPESLRFLKIANDEFIKSGGLFRANSKNLNIEATSGLFTGNFTYKYGDGTQINDPDELHSQILIKRAGEDYTKTTSILKQFSANFGRDVYLVNDSVVPQTPEQIDPSNIANAEIYDNKLHEFMVLILPSVLTMVENQQYEFEVQSDTTHEKKFIKAKVTKIINGTSVGDVPVDSNENRNAAFGGTGYVNNEDIDSSNTNANNSAINSGNNVNQRHIIFGSGGTDAAGFTFAPIPAKGITLAGGEHLDNVQFIYLDRVINPDLMELNKENYSDNGLPTGESFLPGFLFPTNAHFRVGLPKFKIINITTSTEIHTEKSASNTSNFRKKINVYSFALKPEEHQPSGTCNFSRIDTAQLITDNKIGTGHNIYAVNYNVLRIMSGMGGLAYSN